MAEFCPNLKIMLLFLLWFRFSRLQTEETQQENQRNNDFQVDQTIKNVKINRNNIVHKIFDAVKDDLNIDVKINNIQTGDFKSLLKSLKIKECVGDQKDCLKCVDSDRLIKWFDLKPEQHLSNGAILNLLNGLVFIMTNKMKSESFTCNEFDVTISDINVDSLYNEFVYSYGNRKHLHLKNLDDITDDVTNVLQNKFHIQTCLDANEVAETLKLPNEITKEDLTYFNALLVYQILTKKCSNDEINPSTENSHFIEQIFVKYGNSTHLTKDEFEDLAKKIKVGNPVIGEERILDHHDTYKEHSNEPRHHEIRNKRDEHEAHDEELNHRAHEVNQHSANRHHVKTHTQNKVKHHHESHRRHDHHQHDVNHETTSPHDEEKEHHDEEHLHHHEKHRHHNKEHGNHNKEHEHHNKEHEHDNKEHGNHDQEHEKHENNHERREGEQTHHDEEFVQREEKHANYDDHKDDEFNSEKQQSHSDLEIHDDLHKKHNDHSHHEHVDHKHNHDASDHHRHHERTPAKFHDNGHKQDATHKHDNTHKHHDTHEHSDIFNREDTHKHDDSHKHDDTHQHGESHKHEDSHKHNDMHKHDDSHHHDESHKHEEGHKHDGPYKHDGIHKYANSHKNEENDTDMNSHNHNVVHKNTKEDEESDGDDKHSRKRRSTTNKCYSVDNLFTSFNIPGNSVINQNQFKEICPALIQQIESDACNFEPNLPRHTHNHHNHHVKKTNDDDWKPWIGAMLATFFVSLGSLSGVFALPLHGKPFFSYVLMYLVCLAVATLAGDAILHLIPHSIGLHNHKEGGSHEHKDSLSSDSFLWKFVMIIGGVYAFFVFEMLMNIFGSKHGHSHSIDHGDDESLVNIDKSLPKHHEEKKPLTWTEEVIHYDQDTKSELIPRDHKNSLECEKQCDALESQFGLDGLKPGDVHYKASDESIHTTSDTFNNPAVDNSGFKSIVWMVLIGDAIHNFVDGVAIGVAFSESFPAGLQGGISTSIAILCHELPHELGDFAVLITSGLSVKKALVMNFVSSLTAFAGALIGVSIGTKWDATPWIFSLTAGLFLYIALVDMLPEVINNKLLKKKPLLTFILQNLGLLSGFLIMFALAGWEEKIMEMLK